MLQRLTDPCVLCPRECRAARFHDSRGWCRLDDSARISSWLPHTGEEPPLITGSGSGTVFLTGCNAACIFCQNHQISREYIGRSITARELADVFLELQSAGCCNINWVSPTPHLPFLVEALALAIDSGLKLPLVYNTNGYMKPDIVALLDGIVDIFLVDMKYGDDTWAEIYSQCPDYCDINLSAVKEMVRQVGPFPMEGPLTGRRGVIVRHLVLPEGRSGAARVFNRLAAIDPLVPVSIMSQYRPCHLARKAPEIDRPITADEYQEALDAFTVSGLIHAFTQPVDDSRGSDPFFPDFTRRTSEIFS